MKKGLNVLEKLQVISEREVKRREQAVGYIEKLTKILAEPLLEIQGESEKGNHIVWIKAWDKESKKYIYSDMYFRFEEHRANNETEYPGFYISRNDFPYWGRDLEYVKGKEFWLKVKHITDWANNCLNEYLDNLEKSRERRADQLQKLVEKLTK